MLTQHTIQTCTGTACANVWVTAETDEDSHGEWWVISIHDEAHPGHELSQYLDDAQLHKLAKEVKADYLKECAESASF